MLDTHNGLKLRKFNFPTSCAGKVRYSKYATDVTAIRYSGYVTKGTGDTEEKFTGFKLPVVITSVSLANPQGEEEATGSIAWTSSGSQPIDIKAKTWTEAMAQTTND